MHNKLVKKIKWGGVGEGGTVMKRGEKQKTRAPAEETAKLGQTRIFILTSHETNCVCVCECGRGGSAQVA